VRQVNKALLGITRRAEKRDARQLVDSFVEVGSVFHALATVDHQVLYGRRGTGKTHILSYLVSKHREAGAVAVALDMRTIGSSGGLYADPSTPLAERASRLLKDTLLALHDSLLEEACSNDTVDLSACGEALDGLLESAISVRVDQTMDLESRSRQDASTHGSLTINLSGSPTIALGSQQQSEMLEERAERVSGTPRLYVNFGTVQRELSKLVSKLPKAQLWIVLDEWSEVPLTLQPYLADMLTRCMFPVRGITVKIAAIRQRTSFRIGDPVTGYVGLEVGADVSAGIDLDENLVFENNPEAAKEFFRTMLWRHVITADGEREPSIQFNDADSFVKDAFTQITALDELVRAAEGIPRDAINIVGAAATRANDEKISVKHVRAAALAWYQSNKQSAISSRPEAEKLLTWIVEKVIRGKKARAFLLDVDAKDALVDFLYDARAIHLIKQNISGQDVAGSRYNVFSLDYGLYVDLINTVNAPIHLLGVEEEQEGDLVDVPMADYRSIRRAVLDLEEFRRNIPSK